MSQKKIMDLTEVQSVDENSCYVPVDNGSATVRINLHNLEASATESAESYAQAAAASATSASGYADAAALSSASASTYATNASESAADAALSAGSASDSADAAAVSASSAASSASNVTAIVTDVSQQAAVALASAKEAKSWAVGGTDTRAGEDTDNAKYYSIQAGTSASNAATSEANAATSESNAATSETNAAASETNAAASETNAASSETNAATSETNAGASASAAALSEVAAALSRAAAATSSEDAEAWSVGTRNGVPVPATDPAYNNNAKYWAEAAAGAAGGGVTSFNGRSGIVSSQEHDYAATQVDFDNSNTDITSTDVGNAIKEVARNLSDLVQSLATVAKTGSYNDLSDTPSLATVATSGSYTDLDNTPTLGTAAAKNSTSAISSGSTDLIESGSVYSLKQTLTNQSNSIVNVLGAKNLLPNNGVETSTIDGITYTKQSDGSVIANGTATAWAYYNLSYFSLNAGTYILNGKESLSGTQIKLMNADTSADITIMEVSTQREFTLSAKTNVHAMLYVGTAAGTVTNFVFKPMIRPASITDDTYVPYSMTNREMTPYVQAISNPNLLDNPWFTVNQRGQSSYNAGYSIDRWRVVGNAATLTVNSDSIVLTTSAAYNNLMQPIEKGVLKDGQTYTLSLLLGDGTIFSKSFVFEDSSSYKSIYRTALGGFYGTYRTTTNYIEFIIVDSANSSELSITIKAAKLELGSVSTLAMDTAPNYQQELAKCQRYFIRYKAVCDCAIGFERTTAQAQLDFFLPVPIRTTPTITYGGVVKVSGLGHESNSGIDVTSLEFNVINQNVIKAFANVASGLTAGNLCFLHLRPTGYVDISADL